MTKELDVPPRSRWRFEKGGLMEDFSAHNDEAQRVWSAYRAGRPLRAPVTLCADTRFFILNDELNPNERMSFQQYSEDPVAMMDFQLRSAEWRALHIAPHCDDVAGLPDKFAVTVDLQRYFDAAFFGATVEYRSGQTPDARPILAGDHKNMLFDLGQPRPAHRGHFCPSASLPRGHVPAHPGRLSPTWGARWNLILLPLSRHSWVRMGR